MKIDEAQAGPLKTTEDLERLYRAEHLPMLRLARLITGSTALAEEAVQDAFISLYQHRQSVDSPKAYLRRIVTNNCYSVQRRHAVERGKIEVVGGRREAVALPPELDETWHALEVLSPKQRTALVLRFYEDLSLQAVADVMDERLGTVKSLIHRGLKQLQKEVGR
jgi:RNA polymerase sigma factor (sigma-70 family)